jgi:hypothetical protein
MRTTRGRVVALEGSRPAVERSESWGLRNGETDERDNTAGCGFTACAGTLGSKPRAARTLRTKNPNRRRGAVSGRGHPHVPVRGLEDANRPAIGEPTWLGPRPMPHVSRAGCRARGQVHRVAHRAPTANRRIAVSTRSDQEQLTLPTQCCANPRPNGEHPSQPCRGILLARSRLRSGSSLGSTLALGVTAFH